MNANMCAVIQHSIKLMADTKHLFFYVIAVLHIVFNIVIST